MPTNRESIIRIEASCSLSAVRVNTETVYSDRCEAGVVMTSVSEYATNLELPPCILLVNPAQILVQPTENILNQLGPLLCNIVGGIKHDVAFVVRW